MFDGLKVKGVSDVTGADLERWWTGCGSSAGVCRKKTGGVVGFKESETIDALEMMVQKIDILAPCAMERAIDEEMAKKLQCRVLAEGANGPTTPWRRMRLLRNGEIFFWFRM